MSIPLSERPRSGPYAGLTHNSAKRFMMNQFRDAGIEACMEEARALMRFVTGLSDADLIARGTEFMSDADFARIMDLTERRLDGVPVDALMGRRSFFGRDFRITPDVLSPRDDTETLIRTALERPARRILDLGTGSGAMIITLLAELPHTHGVGVDLSPAALLVAEDNARTHGVDDRLALVQGCWFDGVTGTFDLIVSNPPYITDAAMRDLAREVRDHDPDLALRGGPDGLDAYRAILGKAHDYLDPGGRLIFEIGYDQATPVLGLMRRAGFENILIKSDVSGHDRVLCGDRSRT